MNKLKKPLDFGEKTINIAPFSIPDELKEGEFIFPSLHLMRQLHDNNKLNPLHLIKGEDFLTAAVEKITNPTSEELWLTKRTRDFKGNWSLIKNSFRFYSLANYEQLDKQLLKYWDGFPYIKPENNSLHVTFKDTVFDFIGKYFLPQKMIEKIFITEQFIKDLSIQYPEQMKLLITEYNDNWKIERFEKYMDIINEYFSEYDEFAQVHHYEGNDLQLSGNLVTTTNNFKKIKNYYGNAFEELGSLLDFVAALQNISQGRNYDQLEKITLKNIKLLINQLERHVIKKIISYLGLHLNMTIILEILAITNG